jgi:dihydropteroate synthase
LDDGADILDIGGESTRPGAAAVGVTEEAARVIPLIAALARRVKVPLSVDTSKPEVARQALDAGAAIVNLVKGTPASVAMLKLVGRSKAGLVLMHMRGTPRSMARNIRYGNLIADVKRELAESLERCAGYGIARESIVIDPGIGFAKDARQSLCLLSRIDEFASLGYPLLAGTSRKSFIGKTLGVDVLDRMPATAASVALAVAAGVHIVRVHDVKAMRQAAMITDAIINAGQNEGKA